MSLLKKSPTSCDFCPRYFRFGLKSNYVVNGFKLGTRNASCSNSLSLFYSFLRSFMYFSERKKERIKKTLLFTLGSIYSTNASGAEQMTVMSKGLLLNSKCIKMGREEGCFQSLLTQLLLVIVCHELIIWRLTIYGSAMV